MGHTGSAGNSGSTASTGTTYRVMRQDDNGNRYLVAKGLTRPEAEALAAEFEARGHKQMYWVERDDTRGRRGTGAGTVPGDGA